MTDLARVIGICVLAVGLLAVTPERAQAFFFEWGGEKIIKAQDFPDTPEYQTETGAYVDAGYRYKQIAVLFMPLWNYDGEWCGYVGTEDEYWPLSRSDLEAIAAGAGLQLVDDPPIPAWDAYLGRIVFILATLLYFFWRPIMLLIATAAQGPSTSGGPAPPQDEDE